MRSFLLYLSPVFHTTPGSFNKIRWRFKALRWLAQRLSRRKIRAKDGHLYLERFYLCGPLSAETAALWPPEDRPKGRMRWLRKAWYLHCFHGPDPDDAYHSHPWEATGRVLAGGYVDARPHHSGGWSLRRLCEGSRVELKPATVHRIAYLAHLTGDPPEVWTLLGVGPRIADWYFVTKEGKKIPHEQYTH